MNYYRYMNYYCSQEGCEKRPWKNCCRCRSPSCNHHIRLVDDPSVRERYEACLDCINKICYDSWKYDFEIFEPLKLGIGVTYFPHVDKIVKPEFQRGKPIHLVEKIKNVVV